MRERSETRSCERAGVFDLASRFAQDKAGATAVEFGMIVFPFVLLLTGIMVVGLQYFTGHSLERGVAAAARKLRTGEAQKAGYTFADFRKMVCDEAGSFISCNDKLVVHLKSGATFADLDPPVSCLTNGSLTPSNAAGDAAVATYAGGASATVVVTACYEWGIGTALWRSLRTLMASGEGKGSDAKTVISATIAFRSEPYQ